MSHILVVEGDDNLRKGLATFLERKKHSTQMALDFESTERLLEKQIFDVILVDACIQDGSTLDLIRIIKDKNSSAMVIVDFKIDNIDVAVQAIKEGAFGIIQKPVNIDELELKVDQAIEIKRLQQEAQSLRGERNLIYKTEDIIGESIEIKRVFDIVNKVAKSNSSVILIGETGTGKELIAGTIHYNSPRSNGAFVRVNCAALPDELLASELFGHEKGAFTGADKMRIGRFEQADGGTIFLDEIGDMSHFTQAKVLRVIQEKEFERLGSNRTVKTDVRIISATNKNLKEEIKEGRFREDLYYRLDVVTIKVPSLRERRSDILRLANYFTKKSSSEMKKKPVKIHPLAVKMLTDYDWPGNIRELENTIERAVIMAEGDMITPDELNIPITGEQNTFDAVMIEIPAGGISLEEVEKGLIRQALKICEWVQKDAAGLLKTYTRVLNYRIKKYGITHPSWKRNK